MAFQRTRRQEERMKKVLAIATLMSVSAVGFAADQSSFGLEVSLRPSQAGFYVCEGLVKNLESGEVISAPRITVKAGTSATAKTTSGDLVSVLKVSVEPAASMGKAELTVSRAGKVVASQKTGLQLR
jgi:hypothetical protein